jgi:hypothetical protein
MVSVHLAWEHRARLIRIAADGDDRFYRLLQKVIHVLGVMFRDINADLLHHLDGEWMDIAIPTATADAWTNLVDGLIETFHGAIEPITIEPTIEARQMMKEHHNQIVEKRLNGLRDVTTFAARWNEQAWRIAVVLHAGKYGKDAGKWNLDADTVASAIALADWFAGQQLRILARGRHMARRAKRDEVLGLLADSPKGVTARDVQRKRIVDTVEEARALLAEMESDGELTGKDSKPETGGHVTRTYTKGRP